MKTILILAGIILGGVGGPFHSAVVAVFSKLIPDFNSKSTSKSNSLSCFWIFTFNKSKTTA